MSQITHGIRAVLSYSRGYDLFQWLMGAKRGRSIISSQYIQAKDGDRVLDIGCGTAEIRLFLPDVEYCGFDPSAAYVQSAKERLREVANCTLLQATLDEEALRTFPKFDIVLAAGVLHHLSDEEGILLAKVARAALKEGGRLITIDPCFVQDQSPIARFLVSRDRGQHVRNVASYQGIMSKVFGSVTGSIRHDLARFPYTHFIMECTSK